MVIPDSTESDSSIIPRGSHFLLNHEENLKFWKAIHPVSQGEPNDQEAKTFRNIRTLIETEFLNSTKLMKSVKCLKRFVLTDIHDEDAPIRMRSFLQLTNWFGPFIRNESGNSCIFLEQIHKLSSYTIRQKNMKVSPFAGTMTQDESEKLLRNSEPETYLVRFSEGLADKGGFSLAVKANATEVRHYNILGNPEDAAQSCSYNARLKLVHAQYPQLNARESEYKDVVEFMDNRLDTEIEDNIYCTHVCPNLPYNALFSGYD